MKMPQAIGMTRAAVLLSTLACLAHFAYAEAAAPPDSLKVFISVDMEGISGVVDSDQTSAKGQDYERFRKLMTAEANAAIDGARDAGATHILVNDSHGSHRNLLIEELHAPAELISNNIKPMGMMAGLDNSFAAAIFIGYHAKASSAEGVLAHTGNGSTIADLRINGRSVGEIGMNIHAAGTLGVPVVLVSGDQAAIAEARELVPDIEGVQVKEAIGIAAARSLRPEEAARLIREGTARAIRRRGEIKPAPAGLPVCFELSFTDPSLALMAEQIPTVERTGPHTVTFVADDYLEGYRFVRILYKFIQ
jgi:D-amino peptidase